MRRLLSHSLRAGVLGLVVALTSWPAITPATAAAQEVRSAQGALLRGLDKVAGTSRDLDLQVGASVDLGNLRVTLAECRYPAANPASDAFAWVTVYDERHSSVLFDGWMVASSPGLHALDHARYDVWVLACKTS